MSAPQRARSSHGKFGLAVAFTMLTLGALWLVVSRAWFSAGQLAAAMTLAVAVPGLAALWAGRGRIPLDVSLPELLGAFVVPVVSVVAIDPAAGTLTFPLYVATMCWLRVVAFR